MSIEPFSAYRNELRRVAIRRVASFERRRRTTAALAAVLGAALLVGGAIAAHSRLGWLTSSSGQIRVTAVPDRFDHAPKAFTACMASHGAKRVNLRGGGWTYRDAADVEATCGASVSTIRLTCSPPSPSGTASIQTQRCVSTVVRTFGPPLSPTSEPHKRK
jgi:hypothetical protein